MTAPGGAPPSHPTAPPPSGAQPPGGSPPGSDARVHLRRTMAGVRTSRWPGWIWGVPIAAVAIVVWLLIRAISGRGVDVTVVFDEAAGMTANGTTVTYRGVDVGQVTDVAIAADGRHVNVRLSIDDQRKADLTTGTRFYVEGAHPSLSDLSSLKAVLSGPTIVMVPGTGVPTRRFVGTTEPPPDSVRPVVPYLVHLDGAVGDLHVGAPVTMRGFTVGHVIGVELTYDASTGAIATPVTIGLDPGRFHLAGAAAAAPSDSTAWVPVMNAAIATLVREGLRAELTRQPPLIGAAQVELAIQRAPRAASDRRGGARAATLLSGGRYPEIPAGSAGGIDAIATTLAAMPVDSIGANVLAITARMRALVSAPAVRSTIDHLNRTVAALDSTVHDVAPELPAMVRTLGQTAAEIDATVTSVRRVAGGSLGAPDANVQQALHELTEAARSLRTLADFLDQHPEALIKGRSR